MPITRCWRYLAVCLSAIVATGVASAARYEGRGSAAESGMRCAANAVDTLELHVPDRETETAARRAWLVDREAHVWRLDAGEPGTLVLASGRESPGGYVGEARFARRDDEWVGRGTLALPDVDCRLPDFEARLAPAPRSGEAFDDVDARYAALLALQVRMHAVSTMLTAGKLPDVAEPRAIADERARLLGGRHAATLRARWMEGVVLYFHRDMEAALGSVERTLADQRALLGDDHPDTLRTLSRRGHVWWDRGDPRRARDDLERAYAGQVAILSERNVDTLLTLNALAQTLRDLGDLRPALDAQERFERLVGEVRGRDSRAALLAAHNAGLILRDLGRLDEALARQEAVYAAIVRTLGPRHPDAGRVLDAIATLYSDLGRHEDGLRMSEEALRVWQEGTTSRGVEVMNILNNLAGYYIKLDRTEEAIAPQRQALDIALELGGDESVDTNQYRYNLGWVLARLGRHQEALPLYEEAVARLTASVGPSHAKTLHGSLGHAMSLVAMGDLARGVPLLERNIAITTSSLGASHPISVDAQAQLASVYRQAERVADERQTLVALVDAAEVLRANEGLSAENRQSLFEGYAGYYKRLAVLEVRARSNDAALRIAELAKGRTLLEWLAARRAGRVGVLPAEDARRLAELETGVARANDALGVADPSERPELEARKNALVREASQFRAELRERHPKYAALSQITLVDRRAATRLLSRDQVFVSYLLNGDDAIALVVDADGTLRAQELRPMPGIDATVDAYVQSLAALPGQMPPIWRLAHGGFVVAAARPADAVERVRDAGAIGRYLSQRLLVPLQPSLRTKRRWTISPDGVLARLPFETLPWRGEPAIVRHDIGYVQSLSVLALLAQRERTRAAIADASLLAMGAPSYDAVGSTASTADAKTPATDLSPERLASLALRGADPDASRRWFERKGLRWAELPGSAREVEAVATLFPAARVYTGSAASEATLQQLQSAGELANYRYLLFATHAYLSLDAPNMSAVVLAQDRRTAEADGYVTAAEWPAYDLRSELAVLSACETGRGKSIQGEGIVGLPFALAVAGNQATILTLWPVVDASAAKFMGRYFAHLRAGVDKSAALSRTKREFLADRSLRAPLFWAGYVFYGA